jgi:hypothetical protein
VDPELQLVDEARLDQLASELAAAGHHQVAGTFRLEPPDALDRVAVDGGRVPFQRTEPAARCDVLRQRVEHVGPRAGLRRPIAGEAVVALAADEQSRAGRREERACRFVMVALGDEPVAHVDHAVDGHRRRVDHAPER